MGVGTRGGPLGHLRCHSAPFFEENFILNFLGILGKIFLANFQGMKIDFLAETVFLEEAKANQNPTTEVLRHSNKQTTNKTKASKGKGKN